MIKAFILRITWWLEGKSDQVPDNNDSENGFNFFEKNKKSKVNKQE